MPKTPKKPKPDPTHGRKEVTWKDLRPLKARVTRLENLLNRLLDRMDDVESDIHAGGL